MRLNRDTPLPPISTGSRIIPLHEAAIKLGVASETLRAWAEAGAVHALSPDGKNWYIAVSELDAVKESLHQFITQVAGQHKPQFLTNHIPAPEPKGVPNQPTPHPSSPVTDLQQAGRPIQQEVPAIVPETSTTDLDQKPKPIRLVEAAVLTQAAEQVQLSQEMTKIRSGLNQLINFKRLVVGSIIFIATVIVIYILFFTVMLLLFPENTGEFLGLAQDKPTTLVRTSASSNVLGVATHQRKVSIIPKLLKPFGTVSMGIVKRIDSEAYQKASTDWSQTADIDLTPADQDTIDKLAPLLKDNYVIENLLQQYVTEQISSVIGISPSISNSLLNNVTISAEQISANSISNTHIAPNAAILYSKLNLDNRITTEDLLPDVLSSLVVGTTTLKSDGGSITIGGSGIVTVTPDEINKSLTITATESQKVLKNVAVSGQGTISANATDDTLTIEAGSNVTLSTDASNRKLTISSIGGSGTGDITSVVAGNGLSGGAATGDATLTVALTSSGTSATTSSNSGLEVTSSGLGLLRGCSGNQILKWNSSTTVWECGTNATGGSSNPWTQDIDADGFDLQDLSNMEFRETAAAPAGTVVGLYRDNTGDLTTNVLIGKSFNVAVNGTDEYTFSSTAFGLGTNNITTGATTIASTELDLLDGKTILVDIDDAVTTAITGVGTITAGVWNGTALTDTYISDTLTASNLVTGSSVVANAEVDDDLTISSLGSVDWTALASYPTACSAGSAVTAVGDTLTCGSFVVAEADTLASVTGRGATTSTALSITNAGTALLLKPGSAPAANTKIISLEQTGAGTSVFSVDYEGDILASSLDLVTALADSEVSDTLTIGALSTIASAALPADGYAATYVNVGESPTAADISGSFTGGLTIGADKVLESHLKAVDTAIDEECLTYEFTTGDFEWQSCSVETGDAVIGNEVTNATNTTLTRSGAGTGIDPYTLGLNLGNANTWTALQTFSNGGSFTQPANGANDYAVYLKRNTDTASAGYFIRARNAADNTDLFTVTSAGIVSTGTWNGTAVADTYVADTLTIDTSSSVAWTALNTYPTGCTAGNAVTAVGDTLTCGSFVTSEADTLASATGRGATTATALSLTNAGTALLLKPGSAPAANTKIISLEQTGAGTSVFSVDYEGDILASSLDLVTALADSEVSDTLTIGALSTIASAALPADGYAATYVNVGESPTAADISGSFTGGLTIGADKVLESHLKAVDTAIDEECLTYEFTTGDFEWQSCGVAVTADSLNFTDFSDTLALDATTSIGLGASTFGLTFDNNGSADMAFNLSSTGDLTIQDAGAAFAQFLDDGTITFGKSAAASTINIGNSAQAHTITIGNASATGVSIADNNWSISTAGAANFATVEGAGLADCNAAATSKLLWDATTKTFSCGTDQTGGGGATVKSGTVTVTEGTPATVTFTTAFATAPYCSVSVDLSGSGAAISGTAWLTGAPSTTSFTVDYSDNAGGGVKTENIDWICTNGGNADLAEIYPTNDTTIVSGDVVAIDPTFDIGVRKTAKPYDKYTIGIVTTNPAITIGSTEGKGKWIAIVALAGRVPVKVTTENGAILPGDLLTSSSIPGVAMKATKAGQVIGQAMTAYDGQSIGTVIAFIKTSYYNGTQISGISKDQDSISLLSALLTQKEYITANETLSEIMTDRIAAGVEIITPKITAQDVAVDTITAAIGNNVALKLDKDGMFVVKDENGQQQFMIDSEGNATFNGILTVKGLMVEETFTSAITTATESAAVASASASPLPGVTDDGVILTIAKAVQATFDMTVLGKLMALGGLTVDNDALFIGRATFTGVAEFFNEVIFRRDVTFLARTTFNRDTAGFATILSGNNTVDVVFDREYNETPVVTANISFDSINDANAEDIINSVPQYAVVKTSTRGFTVRMAKTATSNLRFAWHALGVQRTKDTISGEQTVVQPTSVQSTLTPSSTPKPSVITPRPSVINRSTIPLTTKEASLSATQGN